MRKLSSLFVLVLAALSGCGSGMYPVEGKLVWQDGSPVKELAEGMVVFEKTDAPLSARGEIQPDGTFRLTTRTRNDGAPLGKYRVVLTEPGLPDTDRVPAPKAHPKYQLPATSGLEFTVEATTNEPVFRLERAPPRKKKG